MFFMFFLDKKICRYMANNKYSCKTYLDSKKLQIVATDTVEKALSAQKAEQESWILPNYPITSSQSH